MMMADVVDRSWRLLPSERVLWRGGPESGVPRDRRWRLIPVLFFAFAVVAGLFAGLLRIGEFELSAARSTALLSMYLFLTGLAVLLLPRYLLDPCQYLITDRQVIWRRGLLRRSIGLPEITYARIYWHRSAPGIGHLELVTSVPFGPFSRKQRILLHDVKSPDRLLALIRKVEPAEFAGYADVKLTDRLDPGEVVIWGASPAGWRLGFPEVLTAFLGMLVIIAGLLYVYRMAGILAELESYGLFMRSWTWLMIFLAMFISGSVILTIGIILLWKGLWGARADGAKTEYLLTNSRLLIRRGLTELSIDRRNIFDVAETPSTAGSRNLHLILDSSGGRALDDNGALSLFASMPRANVPPVLYEIQDAELVRRLLLDRGYRTTKID